MTDGRKTNKLSDFFSVLGKRTTKRLNIGSEVQQNSAQSVIGDDAVRPTRNETERERVTADTITTEEARLNDTEPENSTEMEISALKKRKIDATFQDSWKKKYTWLDTDSKGGMIFTSCISSGKKNPFTSREGCTNFRTSTLTRHAESKQHLEAIQDSLCRQNFIQAEKHAHRKIIAKEKSLVTAMRTAYYIARQNIAVMNYPTLLELQEENGVDLSDLKVGDNATYSSRAAADEFIKVFAEVLQKRTDEEIKESEFISIMIDESTDISIQKKLVVYCKTVSDSLQCSTHFIGNVKICDVSVTGEVLFNRLAEFLTGRGIEWKKVIGFGSDGASLMTGKEKGVATRIKKEAPHCVSVHCMAHRLNLATSKAADSVVYIKDTFQKVLTDLYYYFSKSTARTEELKEIQHILDSPEVKMREVHEIRWMSFYNSLNTIYRSWKALCKYFQSHKTDSSRTKGLFENITDYKFVCCMYLMMDIIPSLAALSMTMQKQDLDISSVRPAIDGIFSAVDQALSSKSYYQQLLHTSHMKKDVKMKQVTVQGVKVNVSKDESIREAQKAFESTRTSFLKSLKDQLDRRFPKKDLKVATSFQVLGLRPLSFLSREELLTFGNEELDVLIEHYGQDQTGASSVSKALIDTDDTRAEWSLVKPLVLEQRYPGDNLNTLWKLVKSNHGNQFPNLVKLAKLGLHIPLQTADCERGFSCQNIIHTSSRNRLDPDKVNQLMTIQIEGPSSKEFPFDAVIAAWKAKKE